MGICNVMHNTIHKVYECMLSAIFTIKDAFLIENHMMSLFDSVDRCPRRCVHNVGFITGYVYVTRTFHVPGEPQIHLVVYSPFEGLVKSDGKRNCPVAQIGML